MLDEGIRHLPPQGPLYRATCHLKVPSTEPLDMAFRQRCGDPNPANSFTVGGLSTPPQGLCQVGCPVSVLNSKFQGGP